MACVGGADLRPRPPARPGGTSARRGVLRQHRPGDSARPFPASCPVCDSDQSQGMAARAGRRAPRGLRKGGTRKAEVGATAAVRGALLRARRREPFVNWN